MEKKADVPAGLWIRCGACAATLYAKELADNLQVCPECGHHHRTNARSRVEQLVDHGTFEEFLEDLVSTDPLRFKDRITYRDRLRASRQDTGETEAVLVGRAYIRG